MNRAQRRRQQTSKPKPALATPEPIAQSAGQLNIPEHGVYLLDRNAVQVIMESLRGVEMPRKINDVGYIPMLQQIMGAETRAAIQAKTYEAGVAATAKAAKDAGKPAAEPVKDAKDVA